ncbi:MAG: hypothetical protein LBT62_04015 [Deltaproteobacteria bacterium]|jgi:hypothetical protein|nr:hypothetical protein [Deltaproteobacteria bacterium]
MNQNLTPGQAPNLDNDQNDSQDYGTASASDYADSVASQQYGDNYSAFQSSSGLYEENNSQPHENIPNELRDSMNSGDLPGLQKKHGHKIKFHRKKSDRSKGLYSNSSSSFDAACSVMS